jgi:comEA protein
MPLTYGLSQLQTKVLAILLSTFIVGLGLKIWRDNHPLPELDPDLEKRFLAISDSLNALALPDKKHKISKDAINQNLKIDINTATVSDLQMLPGIGPTLAKRIVEFRNEKGSFKNSAQLLEVKGIGKKTLEKLSDLITFEE